jgi:hypothetical protein
VCPARSPVPRETSGWRGGSDIVGGVDQRRLLDEKSAHRIAARRGMRIRACSVFSGIDEGDPLSFHRPIVQAGCYASLKGKTMGSPIRALRRIAIGIYVDSDGVADFRIDEILATLGYPLTPENQNEAEQFVFSVYRSGLRDNLEWPTLGDVIT